MTINAPNHVSLDTLIRELRDADCNVTSYAGLGADRSDFAARFRTALRYDHASSRWVPEDEYYDKLAAWQFPEPEGARPLLLAVVVGIVALVWAFMQGGW